MNEQKLLEKYDIEYSFRKKLGKWKVVVSFLAITLTLFQLYTAMFGTLPSQQHRGFHLGLGLGLIFLLFPDKTSGKKNGFRNSLLFFCLFLAADLLLYASGKLSLPVAVSAASFLILRLVSQWLNKKQDPIPWPDLFLALLGVAAGFYQVVFFQEIIGRTGDYSDMDLSVATLAVCLVLEAAKRVVGLPIVVVASVALVYAYAGSYMPGFLAHRGFSVERILSHSYLSTEGILGIPIAVSATFIFLFLFFGVVLNRTGIGQYFNDLAFALTGGLVGGPAKAAVVSSAMQGTVSGSSVANTVGSGIFTIPLMKKTGYTPEFAAAVEASSSTGGQIMPPVMGAAAFLMIEFTDLPYSQIALAALIPALLYFAGIYFAVHFESKRLGILGLPKDQLPDLKELILKKGYLLIPLILIVGILGIGQSPMKAALLGIAAAYLVSFLKKETRLGIKALLDTLEEGARTALGVIGACAAAGIIVGVVTLTGLGLKAAGGIIALANGYLLPTMFFTMITSLILGMGLPTTANYVITATMAAPALAEFGVPPIAAHLFVFYFGIVADITPPVALAAYAGAGLANANPFRTGVLATKIGVAAFLVPYIFVLSPELVMVDTTFTASLWAILTAIVGMVGISSGLFGYFITDSTKFERIVSFGAGLSLVDPGIVTDLAGLAILLAIYGLQKRRVAGLKSSVINSKL
ncbi:TRAP transporter permease [Effusibacillus lacus]|uniref:C4-dicarboxylate ABC transporter n=1 Tax=Effusibacillus lacus TaxID=1348429 RepID=A0A292YRE9_9BACL|nr:TRAP transporter permease [Effusibacillus lacus]TCS75721.1 TRAP transporter 4TM/12TM fusion protein [Effusibacillus lacus]GAX91040.1 C4-dicarboxylate ABC transporter [Effusibacillus lacus]